MQVPVQVLVITLGQGHGGDMMVKLTWLTSVALLSCAVSVIGVGAALLCVSTGQLQACRSVSSPCALGEQMQHSAAWIDGPVQQMSCGAVQSFCAHLLSCALTVSMGVPLPLDVV